MAKSNVNEFDPESAIIDAELLVKYRMVNRAIETLERAIDCAPRHIGLRERLLEVLVDAGHRELAAQRCLELASLYIQEGETDLANEKLVEAKRLDPRISVTGQLRDVRRAETQPTRSQKILAGSLGDVNLFDIIQIIENSKLTGLLVVSSSACDGEIHFEDGLVIGAKTDVEIGRKALSQLAGAVDGSFEFEKSGAYYDRTIETSSNTALILDLLRTKDEEAHGIKSEI